MDDHQAVAADAAYLVPGATLDDETVGPLYTTAADAHRIARTAIAELGGTVRILQPCDADWTEVARYTDTGQQLGQHRLRLAGLLVAADED